MTTWLGSTNVAHPNGRTILGLVVHSSECALDVMTRAFNTPGGASAHYAISEAGGRFQYVRDQDVAFHVAAFGGDVRLNRNRPNWLPAFNGLYSAVNASTLGVELEGFAARGFTPAQYAELGKLIAEKSLEHGFAPTLLVDLGPDARVLTHGWLQTDRSDPGALFQWESLRAALEGDLELTPEQQRILDAAARNGLDDAGIDNMMGINRLLGEQKTSLEELLRTSQSETAAQAAEAERLRQLVTAPAVVDVTRVAVTLSDGREVVR